MTFQKIFPLSSSFHAVLLSSFLLFLPVAGAQQQTDSRPGGIYESRQSVRQQSNIAARLNMKATFEDSVPSVTFHIEVREGAQYRMGQLSLNGISEAAIGLLKKRWKLKAGDIFDESYINEFLKSEFVRESREVRQRSVNRGDT